MDFVEYIINNYLLMDFWYFVRVIYYWIFIDCNGFCEYIIRIIC